MAQSVQGGRRARRIRNITVGAGVFTAVAVVAGVAVAGTVHHGGTSAIAQSASTKYPKPVPIAQPAGPKSPVTPAAVVEETLRLLPKGGVAEMLGLSEGTVKVQSQRARAVLRRMLAEESPARSARP